MKKTYTIVILFVFYSCVSQSKHNTGNMEKFNIEEFEAHKVAGEYNRIMEDGSQLNQFGNSAGYFEKMIPVKGWFYSYKEFYGNGNLSTKGTLFKKGDYKTGHWIECDSNGVKTNETNFDAPYQLTLNSIFEILSKEGIKFSITDTFNTITRHTINSKSTWFVEWKETQNRIETLEIDDKEGKVIHKSFYKLEEDH